MLRPALKSSVPKNRQIFHDPLNALPPVVIEIFKGDVFVSARAMAKGAPMSSPFPTGCRCGAAFPMRVAPGSGRDRIEP